MPKKRVTKNIVIVALVVSILVVTLSESFAREFQEKNIDVTLGASVGYRIDDLAWNIAEDQLGLNPHILSEIRFDDGEVLLAGLATRLVIQNIYFRTSIYLGEIKDGQCSDSDYLEGNRHGLYSKSASEIDNDDILDVNVGLGYLFNFMRKKLSIIPLTGVSCRTQHISLTNGIQIVATPGLTPELGPLAGLDSSYGTQWRTWWLGAEVSYEIATGPFVSSSLEYPTLDFEATANWNLREDLTHPVTFVHEADGDGVLLAIGLHRLFDRHWNIGLVYRRQEWSAEGGIDRLFLADGQTTESRLNEVNWNSHTFNLLLNYRF